MRPPLIAVLFDLDDTLIEQTRSDTLALRAAAAVAQRAVRSVRRRRFQSAVRRHARQTFRSGQHYARVQEIGISPMEALWARFTWDSPLHHALREWSPGYRHQVWTQALAVCGVHDSALVARLEETFARERRQRHVLFPDAEPVLKHLHGRYRLGLLTNGAACLQREKLQGSRLGPYFDTVIVSGEMGTGKPNPDLFLLALEQLGARPDQAAMVGDNPARDILGARRAGMRSIWLNRGGNNRAPSVQADVEIHSLNQLEAALG